MCVRVCVAQNPDTRPRRCRGCLKLQVSFRKRATDYRTLLSKMTYMHKTSLQLRSTTICTHPNYHTLFLRTTCRTLHLLSPTLNQAWEGGGARKFSSCKQMSIHPSTPYTHTHIHTYTHTHIHTCVSQRGYVCKCIHIYTHTLIHTYTHTHIHALTHTRLHTIAHAHLQMHTHTHT